MKQIFLFFFLLLFSRHTTFAQATVDDLMNDSAKLYVEFADYQGFTNDSIYISLRRTSLYLGKKAAIYTYQTKTVEEVVKGLRESLHTKEGRVMDKEAIINSVKNNYDLEKDISVVYVRYYTSPDYLLLKKLDNGDVWLSDTAVYKWAFINEFKTISNYKCQKATFNNSKGEEVVVWFTEEIPISSGPLYLSGLPGLILEYYNPKSKRFFTATTISSTNIPEQKFRKWLSGPIVTKAEYRVIHADGLKKFQQFKRMMESEISTKQ